MIDLTNILRRIYIGIWRHRRTREHELSRSIAMIDGKAHRIPQLRDILPFVKQSRGCAFQQPINRRISQQQVNLAGLRIGQVQHAFGLLLASGGFSTPLRATHPNCSHIGKLIGQNCVDNSFLIICHNMSIISYYVCPCQCVVAFGEIPLWRLAKFRCGIWRNLDTTIWQNKRRGHRPRPSFAVCLSALT